MQMKIRDKIKFAGIFFKSLWQPTNNLTVDVKLSEDGCYHLRITDDTDAPEALELYG